VEKKKGGGRGGALKKERIEQIPTTPLLNSRQSAAGHSFNLLPAPYSQEPAPKFSTARSSAEDRCFGNGQRRKRRSLDLRKEKAKCWSTCTTKTHTQPCARHGVLKKARHNKVGIRSSQKKKGSRKKDKDNGKETFFERGKSPFEKSSQSAEPT